MRRNSGVYIYRALKPAARLRIPFLSYHFAYVGETRSFFHRHIQHIQGGGLYGVVPKPWADLEPYVWLRIPLPPWKWLLRTVEAVVILLTWPVYNISGNRWNPRRIKPWDATRQRALRDKGQRYGYEIMTHFAAICIVALLCLLLWMVA